MNGPTYQWYYGQIERIIRERLDREDAAYLLQVNFEEYLAFLIQETKWEPLLWDESKMTVEPGSLKKEKMDDRLRNQTYVVDVPFFRLRFPTSPHRRREDYFKFEPSTWKGAEPEWKFEGDVLVHDVEQTEQAVKRGIDDVRFWLGNRNKEIEDGNKQLPERIRRVWETKRHQLEEKHSSTQDLLRKLNLPLHQDPNAKVKPVEIKPRQLNTVIEKPKATDKAEPALTRSDVVDLVDFIEQYCRQFEVAPKTYQKMDEEELRDLLVGMMNANYPGRATGETFNKLGKTDISLRVDSGQVLVCECKFWGGAKAYNDAIEQIFRYLTWRQNYGVLINFCKLKNMTTAISEGKKATEQNPSFADGTIKEGSETRFSSRHSHPQDASRSVEVFHLFIDLSI